MPTIAEITEINRKNAKHGEFFFAQYLTVTGDIRKSPVFVLSNECDKNDDVIICLCTKSPPKSEFDVKVQLKVETRVRTNKIYTISRSQLLFKIPQTAQTDEYNEIITKLKLAVNVS